MCVNPDVCLLNGQNLPRLTILDRVCATYTLYSTDGLAMALSVRLTVVYW